LKSDQQSTISQEWLIGRIDGRLDEAKGVVEARDQLGRHDILIEHLLGLGDAFAQVEYEVAFANSLGELDQVADAFLGHGLPPVTQLSERRLQAPARAQYEF
jgi:hypothetical protein